MAGKNGGTWRHDYVPTNMQAAILKAHGSRKGAAKALRSPLRKMTTQQLEQHYQRPDVGNSGHAVKATLRELDRRESANRRLEAAAARKESARATRNAVQDAHRSYLEQQFVSAESSTRGNMVNKRGVAKGIDGRSLLTGSAAQRDRYASDELKSYLDRNPVIPAAEFSASMRGNQGSAVRHARARVQRRSYGVY
jgi:hypothetical protein